MDLRFFLLVCFFLGFVIATNDLGEDSKSERSGVNDKSNSDSSASTTSSSIISTTPSPSTISTTTTTLPSTTSTTTTTLPSTTSTTTTTLPSTTSTTTTTLPSTTSTTTTTSPSTTSTTTTTSPSTTSTTTTTSPSTSTTPIPSTTTVSPDVNPSHDGHWNVTKDNITCISLSSGLELNLLTSHADLESTSMSSKIVIPKSANVSGGCGNLTQYIKLSYPAINISMPRTNSLQIIFSRNATTGNYRIVSINGIIFTMNSSSDLIKEFSFSANVSSADTILANRTYTCSSPLSFALNVTQNSSAHRTTSRDDTYTGQLLLTHTNLYAFCPKSTCADDIRYLCSIDREALSDAVPIVIGVTLTLLVVIMLVVYLIVHFRYRQVGYQSV